MREACLSARNSSAASEAGSVRWYAVHTHSKAEDLAARNLHRQGFETFLPLRSSTIKHARRTKCIKCAYFPRYLFVSLDLDRDRWLSVNSTVGVMHLLSACNRPLPVRRGLVESLRSVTGPDGVMTPNRLLKPGQKIQLLTGPFAERIGTLDQVKSMDAVRVLFSMMDREVYIEVPRDMVHAVD